MPAIWNCGNKRTSSLEQQRTMHDATILNFGGIFNLKEELPRCPRNALGRVHLPRHSLALRTLRKTLVSPSLRVRYSCPRFGANIAKNFFNCWIRASSAVCPFPIRMRWSRVRSKVETTDLGSLPAVTRTSPILVWSNSRTPAMFSHVFAWTNWVFTRSGTHANGLRGVFWFSGGCSRHWG